MSKKIKLNDIIEAMELSSEESRSFLYTETGEVILLTDDDFRMAGWTENHDKLPAWQREAVERAMDLEENTENYIELPGKYEIDEHEMMIDFALGIEDEKISTSLYKSLHGKGAFRRFKDSLGSYGLWDRWNSFQSERLREIALEWCEDNGLDVIL